MVAQKPDLSIVIPAYCEERRIGATLRELATYLKHDPFCQHKIIEVLVVAADAPDKTHQIVTDQQPLFDDLKLLKPGPKVGKGRDVQYGMLRASGAAVLFMDADLATPLHHIEYFHEAIQQGNDMVIGTRNLLAYRANALRNTFSYVGNLLYQVFSTIHVEDTQCGFKMFSHQACSACFSKLTILGWDFDVELLAIAKVNGLSIKSRRIDDWVDQPFSTHTDRPLRIAFRTTTDFLRVAGNLLRGTYKTRL